MLRARARARERERDSALFNSLFSDRARVIAETRNLLRSLENANETPFRLALLPRNAREALIRLARKRDRQPRGMGADDEGVSSGMTRNKSYVSAFVLLSARHIPRIALRVHIDHLVRTVPVVSLFLSLSLSLSRFL